MSKKEEQVKKDVENLEKLVKARKERVIRSRVTEEKYQEVQKYIHETGMSVSSLVALAVSEYMKNNK